MNLRNIDLNLLVILEVLLEQQHVSRAAAVLCMSQPAVSKHLKKLRDLFSDPLLVTTAEGYTLSDKALTLQTELKPLLSALRHIVENETFDAQTTASNISFYGLDTESNVFFVRYLPILHQLAPNMQFSVTNKPADPFKLLESGEVHFVVSGLGPTYGSQQLYNIKVSHTQFVGILGKRHPKANVKSFSLNDYLSCKHAVVAISGEGPSEVDHMLSQQGLNRNVVFRLSNFSLAASLCETNDIVMTVPYMVAQQIENRYDIRLFELPSEVTPPPFDVHLYWHRRNHQNVACQWVRRQIVNKKGAL
ncbi:LysR family transcriptional regulator [Vibrio coralliilyticus]|uniref:LysR family transcriptional regulator n=1 Tax=Vibrio coralliilyticus TaxID=190893 RepID=UPI002FD51747